jgi:hypothetical protein
MSLESDNKKDARFLYIGFAITVAAILGATWLVAKVYAWAAAWVASW